MEDQHDDLDSSSSGLTEESASQTSSDSGSSGSYPSVSSGGSGAEPEEDETVQVDFEFFDPQEGDFHGLKALLHTYLDGEAFSCSELVEAIIQQVSLCCRSCDVLRERPAALSWLACMGAVLRCAPVSGYNSPAVPLPQRFGSPADVSRSSCCRLGDTFHTCSLECRHLNIPLHRFMHKTHCAASRILRWQRTHNSV